MNASRNTVMVGTTAVIAAPPEPPPFPVQAVVEEQDTCLILDIGPVLREPGEDYPRLVKRMRRQRPRAHN